MIEDGSNSQAPVQELTGNDVNQFNLFQNSNVVKVNNSESEINQNSQFQDSGNSQLGFKFQASPAGPLRRGSPNGLDKNFMLPSPNYRGNCNQLDLSRQSSRAPLFESPMCNQHEMGN